MADVFTSTARLRQSCDRCHGQKLRCVRDHASTNASSGVAGDQKGTCQRCSRLRMKCVYSLSAPKGRPSIYRIVPRTDAPERPPSAGVTTSEAGPALDEPSHAAASMPENGSESVASRYENSATTSYQTTVSASEPACEVSEFNEANMHFFESEYDMDQWFQQFAETGGIDSANVDANMFDWSFDGSSDGHGQRGERDARSPNSEGTSSGVFSTYRIKPASLERAGSDDALSATLEKLSRLNMRLCTLNSLTSAFALEGCPRNDGPIIDEATVMTITCWMSHASNGTANDKASAAAQADQSSSSVGFVMCDIFSASRELLDILISLAPLANARIAEGSSSGASQILSETSGVVSSNSSEYSHPVRTSPSMVVEGEVPTSQLSIAIDQMVIACSILLMNIFTVVLTAILRDAELWVPTTPMADIRPILITQVCSYVIDRQNRALDLYNKQQRPWPIQSFNHEADTKASELQARREELIRLQDSVRTRFTRLREFLHM